MREKPSMVHWKKMNFFDFYQQNEPKTYTVPNQICPFFCFNMVTSVHKKRPFSWTK